MDWFEITSLVFSIVVLTPFLMYSFAMIDVFFTRLESGNIKYIFTGETLKKIIADVEGKKVDGHEIVLGEEKRSWMNRVFGIYYIGMPPFNSVKWFSIKRRKELEDTSNKPIAEWIRELGELRVNSLRAAFPRPFMIENAELGDRQVVNLMVVAKLIVVNAYIPIVELKGEFFELTSSILRGAVLNIIENHPSMDAFIAADKSEEGILSILCAPNSEFNKTLKARVGLQMVGATIPGWDPADPTIREAMNLAFKASHEREGIVIQAQAYAERVKLETTADAQRIRALGRARGKQIRETVAAMASTMGDPNVVARGTADVLEMEAATSPTSKLTTLVKGSGIQPAILVGEKK